MAFQPQHTQQQLLDSWTKTKIKNRLKSPENQKGSGGWRSLKQKPKTKNVSQTITSNLFPVQSSNPNALTMVEPEPAVKKKKFMVTLTKRSFQKNENKVTVSKPKKLVQSKLSFSKPSKPCPSEMLPRILRTPTEFRSPLKVMPPQISSPCTSRKSRPPVKVIMSPMSSPCTSTKSRPPPPLKVMSPRLSSPCTSTKSRPPVKLMSPQMSSPCTSTKSRPPVKVMSPQMSSPCTSTKSRPPVKVMSPKMSSPCTSTKSRPPVKVISPQIQMSSPCTSSKSRPLLKVMSPRLSSPCTYFGAGDMTMIAVANFDRVPGDRDTDSPRFAYKPERAIRKKAERAKLEGFDCDLCRKYYEAIASQLTDEEMRKIKNRCSRHRSKYPVQITNTPPNYWDPDFPSTQECIQRGYMGIGIRTPPSKLDKEVPPISSSPSRRVSCMRSLKQKAKIQPVHQTITRSLDPVESINALEKVPEHPLSIMRASLQQLLENKTCATKTENFSNGSKSLENQKGSWRILKQKAKTTVHQSGLGDMTLNAVENFDRVPGDPDSPGFAYKPDRAIRKKTERAKLEGVACDLCCNYYEAIASQLTDEEMRKIKNRCSKHRSKYPVQITSTPPNYWDPDFPTTQECIQRGYMGIGTRTPPSKPDEEVSPISSPRARRARAGCMRRLEL